MEFRRVLRSHLSQVVAFHSDSSKKHKDQVLNMLEEKEPLVVCCTSSLGMGFDVGDVRMVIFFGIPKSVLKLAQIFGRACRDGRPGKAILVVSKNSKAKKIVEAREEESYTETIGSKRKATSDGGSRPSEVELFAFEKGCLRKKLLGFFGQNFHSPQDLCCSRCEWKFVTEEPNSRKRLRRAKESKEREKRKKEELRGWRQKKAVEMALFLDEQILLTEEEIEKLVKETPPKKELIPGEYVEEIWEILVS